MKIFINGVGRPSNETKRKRRIIICLVVAIIILLFSGLVVFFSQENNKLNASVSNSKTDTYQKISKKLFKNKYVKVTRDSFYGKINKDYIPTIYTKTSSTIKYTFKNLTDNSLILKLYHGFYYDEETIKLSPNAQKTLNVYPLDISNNLYIYTESNKSRTISVLSFDYQINYYIETEFKPVSNKGFADGTGTFSDYEPVIKLKNSYTTSFYYKTTEEYTGKKGKIVSSCKKLEPGKSVYFHRRIDKNNIKWNIEYSTYLDSKCKISLYHDTNSLYDSYYMKYKKDSYVDEKPKITSACKYGGYVKITASDDNVLNKIAWVDEKTNCNKITDSKKTSVYPSTSVLSKKVSKHIDTNNKIKACVWDIYGHVTYKTVTKCK